MLACLLVTKRMNRSDVARVAVLLQQRLRLSHEAVGKHLRRATVDTVIQLFARRVETQPQNPKAEQRVPSLFLPQSAHGARAARHTSIALTSFGASLGCIFAAEVESSRCRIRWRYAGPLSAARARRRWRISSERCGPGNSPSNRARRYSPVPPTTIGKRPRCAMSQHRRACLPGILPCREGLIRIGNINQVMWNPAAIFLRRLGSPDLKVAINSNRVATYDLSRKSLCQRNGERTLAGPGRSKNDNEQRFRRRRRHSTRAPGNRSTEAYERNHQNH